MRCPLKARQFSPQEYQLKNSKIFFRHKNSKLIPKRQVKNKRQKCYLEKINKGQSLKGATGPTTIYLYVFIFVGPKIYAIVNRL